MTIYTENVDGNIILSDTNELLQDLILEFMGLDLSSMMEMGESSSSSPLMSLMAGGAWSVR